MGREVVLVGMPVARFFLGADSEAVAAMVDDGRLMWVWDFSATGSRRRDLRFWVPELRALPDGRPHADPREGIGKAIGRTPDGRQRSAEMEVRWSMSAQLVRSLVDLRDLDGPIQGHTRFLTRQSMEAFLLARLVR